MSWRVTISVVLLALLAVGLAGCGDQTPPPKGQAALRLVVWKPNQPGLWRRLLEGFARQHPGLKVKLEIGPHSSTAFHDLLTQKLKNQSPEVDVFLMDVIWPPEFASAGWALPLDGYLPPAAREAFLPATILANTWRGRLYGVPVYIDCGLLYYRRDLLAKYGYKPPATWAELVAQARTIVAQEGRGLVGYSGQFKQYEGLVCDMLEFVWSAGGAALDPSGRRSLLAAPPAVKAVGFVRDEIIGGAAPRGVLAYQEPESLSLFSQGQAVFMRNWPYAWALLADPDKSRVAGRVGLAPLPAFPGGRSASALGGWQLGISAFSRRPAEAWKLVQYLSSEVVQRRLALEAGLAPSRKALYRDPWVLKARPQFKVLGRVLAGARPRPRTPLYPAVSHRMQRYFHAAISRRDSDIPALAAQASAEIDRLLSLTRER